MAAAKTGIEDYPGRHAHRCFHPAAGAGDATASVSIFEAMNACRVKRIAWIPSAAVTGQITDHFTLDVINVGAAGAGTASLVTPITFDDGVDAVALDATEFTLSTTDATISLAAGDVLAVKRTLVESGLAMPSGMFVIEYEPK